jgi:hypothetical protein
MKLSPTFRNELRKLCQAAQERTGPDDPDFIFADFVLGYLRTTELTTTTKQNERRARLFPAGMGRAGT